ncbi:transposase [Streptomyces sp. XY431]|uniref:transposase n=1 Tax=Streptomyces sp. XY431 TaxID=1415562 RepID=UPI0006B00786|nr:transposase [Streptomyces sp. XY431]
MTKVWVDAGCNNAVVKPGAALSIDIEAVARDKEQKGFVVQPIRWRVERTFGVMSRYRRIHRDYEELPDRSRSMIHWAMVNPMTARLSTSPDEVGQYLRPKPPAAA